MCCATPTTAEALSLRDSAQLWQGRVWRNLACIFKVACRDFRLHLSRGKRGSNFSGNDDNPNGGAACIVPLPPSLKTFIMHAYCMQQRSDEARATKSHDGSHPAMPLMGIFGGNLIRVLGP